MNQAQIERVVAEVIRRLGLRISDGDRPEGPGGGLPVDMPQLPEQLQILEAFPLRLQPKA